MVGPVCKMSRTGMNVCPPSRDRVNCSLLAADHTAYSVPSLSTAPAKPSNAPLSSRGSPRWPLISLGSDHVMPPSVERDSRICESVRVHRVHPTYRLPLYGPSVSSATMYGLSSHGMPGSLGCSTIGM